MRYSVVVCCYNCAAWIDELVERVGKVMERMGGPYEVVLVNDSSPDADTWPAVRRLAETHSWARAVDLQFNVGQFRALMCGLGEARGEVVITLDDDLQHPPEEIPKLVEVLETDPGVQAVIGVYDSKQHSRFRNLGSRLVDSVYGRAYGKPRGLRLTSFRALRRPVVEALVAHQTIRPVPGALLLQSTRRIRNVPVEHHPRVAGRSGWRTRRLVGATLDNMVAGSLLPLRLVSGLGLVTAGLALLIGLGYLIAFLIGAIQVQGFTTLVLLLTLFGGLTLAAIGLVGEYLGRVVAEVTGQPRYMIRERVD